jgi:TPR repeat protein
VVVSAVPRKAETPPHSPAVSTTASGSLELATAQDYLTGKNRPRDSAAAAAFLWAAVRKENTTAVLLLSELYLAGDGVPKNCDQARILLMAAARKQVPDAVRRLHELGTSGCP